LRRSCSRREYPDFREGKKVGKEFDHRRLGNFHHAVGGSEDNFVRRVVEDVAGRNFGLTTGGARPHADIFSTHLPVELSRRVKSGKSKFFCCLGPRNLRKMAGNEV
jgi:hypothetical protein